MSVQNPKSENLSSYKILTIGSVCIAVLLIAYSYKTSANNIQAPTGIGELVAGSMIENVSDNRLQEALDKARLQDISDLQTSNPFAVREEDNTSARFTKNTFNAFLKYDQGGYDPNQLAEDVVNDIRPENMPTDKYTIADVKTYNPANAGELKAYGMVFADKYISAISPVSQNPNKYNKPSEIAEVYKKASRDIIQIPAPSALALEHLRISNNLERFADAMVLVEKEEKTNPVNALLAVGILEQTSNEQAELFITLKKYFDQNGIIFDRNTSEAMWLTIDAS
jgi:hypothetical protein